MSVNFTKSPVWIVAVIAGLVAATALVAGYVDRPGAATCGSGSTCAATSSKCADCPKAGTEECCKVTGTCAADAAVMAQTADATGGTCPAGGTTTMAQTAEVSGGTCPASGMCPAGAAMMAQQTEGACGGCPAMAAQAAEKSCSTGQCPATK